MLCAIRKSNNRSVIAKWESKANGPFTCPECGDEVVLRQGSVRVNHFTHKSPLACGAAGGETNDHRRCKLEIYEALLGQAGVTDVCLERSLGTVRPDVSARIKGVPVAIEVQISNLSQETIIRRTKEYESKGIYVLWLPQWSPYLDGTRYSPRLWERWVHAAYFGRVYYWMRGIEVACYHFDPHYRSIRETTWYSKNGERMTSRGYNRKSKRYRAPVRHDILNLVRDFVPVQREFWQTKGFIVPSAKLFVHRGAILRRKQGLPNIPQWE
jgi:competence protein CoiA